MNNFIVGLTDVSPDTTPVSVWNYDVCGQYPGAVPDAVTVYLQCDQSAPPRRYLVVQSPASVYLSFCEIEVYLRRKSKIQSRLYTCVVLFAKLQGSAKTTVSQKAARYITR